ncbi:MAG: hypothetical protein VYD87_04720 [Pseudomonadota bacterium]|nr:hypothetical protein [Pseudomonadota bacterium]
MSAWGTSASGREGAQSSTTGARNAAETSQTSSPTETAAYPAI